VNELEGRLMGLGERGESVTLTSSTEGCVKHDRPVGGKMFSGPVIEHLVHRLGLRR
jgi:hypothetical protein